ncbi:ganglioside-induced differentiation-associated protein 1-like [Ptychodera flava]|uniref:ganglioside-induced differentiation-associated protein 1-like n=1 Tax=Ptychodera flava TaxID=63121 RepID=UPI00396A4E32
MSDPILYYSEKSLHCHRVRVALYEKGIRYKQRCMDVAALENLSDWFVKINPDTKVPTLRHGDKILTDPDDIIRYLDDAFVGKSRLFPDASTEEGKMCEYFIRIAEKIDINTLALAIPELPGFDEYKLKNSYPTSYYRDLMKGFQDKAPELCEKMAERYPELKTTYDDIREKAEKIRLSPDDETLGVALPLSTDVMTKLEMELKRNKDAKGKMTWLCGETFTAADIYFSTTLRALYDLGLDDTFWGNEQRPLVAEYFLKGRTQSSFVQTAPALDDGAYVMKMRVVQPEVKGQGQPCCGEYPCTII